MRQEQTVSDGVTPSVASVGTIPLESDSEKREGAVWLRPLLLFLLVTTLFLSWAYFVRSGHTEEVFAQPAFRGFEFDPYVFGLGVQEYAIPLVLLLFLSRTAIFRRIVTGVQTQHDIWLLAVIFVSLQILYAIAQYGLIKVLEDQLTVGFLIVFVAGWLGGWQVGLTVGFVAMVTIGLTNYVMWGWEDAFDFHAFFEYWVLKGAEPNAAVWLGCSAGLVATAIPRWRRFTPVLLVSIGLLFEVITAVVLVFSIDDASWYLLRLPSLLVIAALGFFAFALIVRNVQQDDARVQAEAAQRELAEANLTLTRTQLALTQAELRALHAQINPHFFFNSLNTIRYFIRTDPDVARDLLTQLSELFQRALSAGEFVPLQEEISHVEAYLALEKARLDERLTIIWTNLAKELLEQQIPTLILQPIVENAVIHGISPKTEGGTVHIVINCVGDELLMQVDDDGIGFEVTQLDDLQDDQNAVNHEARPHNAIGLRNVDERLRMLYGEQYGLQIESSPDRGTRVVMRVPLTDKVNNEL